MKAWASFVDVVRARAQAEPDRLVFSTLEPGRLDGDVLTVGALDREAQAVAATLQALGAQGRAVLLLYPTGLEFLSAFFGCLYAGALAIPAPLPEASRLSRTLPRLLGILEDARPLVVMCTDADLAPLQALFAKEPAFQGLIPVTVSRCRENTGPSWQPPVLTPDSPAYLQYTSGSTSLPRGNLLSHRNLLICSEYIQQAKRYSPESVAVVWVPAYHDDGLVHGILQPLFTGSRSVLMASSAFVARPQHWLQAISHHRATHSGGPNFAYELCTQRVPDEVLPSLDLSSWRFAYNAAEPIRAETLRQFYARFQRCGFAWESFAPCYGLAEATLTVSAKGDGRGPTLLEVDGSQLAQTGRIQLATETAGSRTWVGCGPPVGALDVRIVRPGLGSVCDADEIGEVLVHGPTLTQGYIGKPEETAATFLATLDDGHGPFLRTGDLGFFHGGELFITGRLKDLIIVRGRNLYAHDLERVVEQADDAIRPGCVAAFPLETGGHEGLGIVAEIDAAQLEQRSPESVLDAIRLAVASAFEVQAHTVALVPARSILKTSSGKLQRRQTGAALLSGTLQPLHVWRAPAVELDPASPTPASLGSGPFSSPLSAAPQGKNRPEVQPRALDPDALAGQLWRLLKTLPGLALPASPDLDTPLKAFGLDSVTAAEASACFSDVLHRSLPETLLFDHPTLRKLAHYLAEGPATDPAGASTGEKRGRIEPSDTGAASIDPIVIVSMACRLPGDLHSPEALWELLARGGEAIGPVPPGRSWSLETLFDPDPQAVGKTYVTGGGFLSRIDLFDAPFFRLTASEARGIDPQQRLLLMLAWEAFERAGLDPARVEGRNIGVFVGLCTNDYAALLPPLEATEDGSGLLGCAPSVASGRIAYTFGLEGPTMTIDTACSSSLVAFHQACRALEGGECELALVGGVTLFPSGGAFVAFSRLRALSPDGRCRSFSEQASGFGLSEGGGLVLLTRQSVALRQNLPGLAVVRGSAINQDGRSQGLTAPNGLSQQRVIRAALARAGLRPTDIDVVEGHGSGTRLGDLIEIEALQATYAEGRRDSRAPQRPLLLGSVKSNLGHLQAAAGIVGILKSVLALQHRQVPATLHCHPSSTQLERSRGLLEPVQQLQDWPEHLAGSERPRPGRVAISSFGISGTNAHVILEEGPSRSLPGLQETRDLSGSDTGRNLAISSTRASELPLLISARQPSDLRRLAQVYADYFGSTSTSSWERCVHTAAVSRAGLGVRACIAVDSREAAVPALKALAEGSAHPALHWDTARRRGALAFVYPGQGSQWDGMGRVLLEEDAAFASAIEACDRALRPHTGWSLRGLLESGEKLAGTADVVQPVLFGMAYALTQSWRALGIEPTAVVGHSQGEIVAAVVCGALSLETGARLAALRGQLAAQLSGRGALLAVMAPHSALESRVSELSLWISAVNGPSLTVVGGETPALQVLAEALSQEGVSSRWVGADYASHTPLVQPVLATLEAELAQVPTQPARLPMISTVTGQVIEPTALDARYWCDNLRQPVRFDLAMKTLVEQGFQTFVEVSAHPILTQAMAEALQPTGDHKSEEGPASTRGWAQASLRREEGGGRRLLRSLGELWVSGVEVDWRRLVPPELPVADLPTYPFQGERCWPDSPIRLAVRERPEAVERGWTGAVPAQTTLREATLLPVRAAGMGGRQEAAPLSLPVNQRRDSTMMSTGQSRVTRVLGVIRQELPWLSDEQIESNKGLPALGIESLKIMALQSALQRKLGVRLPNGLFFDGKVSLRDLAEKGALQLADEGGSGSEEGALPGSPGPGAFVEATAQASQQANSEGLASSFPVDPGISLATGDLQALAQLMAAQVQAMSDLTARQLDTLRGLRLDTLAPRASVSLQTTPPSQPNAPQQAEAGRIAGELKAQGGAEFSSPRPASSGETDKSTPARPVFVPYKSLAERAASAPRHAEDYLGELVEEFCAFTPASKAKTQQDRFVFANNRNIAGLTPVVKEMSYQVIAERASGAYFEDLDGNRFIDLTMSFGACLLGHGHPALTAALQDQLHKIWSVGPISPHAGEVASRVAALTGVERVAFFNSGTEAVMVAMRLARTATGRPKIALFSGSYHGMVEGVLAMASPAGAPGDASPMSPGVTDSQVHDTLVLRYDDPRSLEILEARAHEVAGVLVEPVQARRLDLQPRQFLHSLRALTQRLGIALIFDEMITGFRVMPGGAQAWFGVKADLVAYGKVLGGGMPIGVVAGAPWLMDGIDGGGGWQFGDDSFPLATNTFVAGTFCSHPLAMACSVALLEELQAQGPGLQRTLAARTRRLVVQLNDILADEALPIHVTQFSSLFRFEMPPEYSLLYHRLVSRGIYVWELRGCALSTAHSDADLAKVVETVRETARWLAQTVAQANPKPHTAFGLRHVQASEVQQGMFRRAQATGNDTTYHVRAAWTVQGDLDPSRLEVALAEVVHRHEILRAGFRIQGQALLLRLHPVGDYQLTFETLDEDQVPDFLARISTPFDLSTPSLLRCGVATLCPGRHILALCVHHLVVDGLSLELLLEELLTVYGNGILPPLSAQYTHFLAWERAYRDSPRYEADRRFWHAQLEGRRPRTELPLERFRPAEAASGSEKESAFRAPAPNPGPEVQGTSAVSRRAKAGTYAFELSAPTALRSFAQAHGATCNALLNSIFQVFLLHETGQAEQCFGSPTSGRPAEEYNAVIGLFIGVMVWRQTVAPEWSFSRVLEQTCERMPGLLDAQHYPFQALAQELDPVSDRMPLFDIGFSFESSRSRGTLERAGLTLIPHPWAPRDVLMSVVLECADNGHSFALNFVYNADKYQAATVERWARTFDGLAQMLTQQPLLSLHTLFSREGITDAPVQERQSS